MTLLVPEHIDYLVAYGISQDEYDFLELIAEGVFGYSLTPDSVPAAQCDDVLAPLRKTGAFRAAAVPPLARELKGYKPICPFGGLGMMLCAMCIRLKPFDGRRLFCPVGEMW